MGPIRWVDILWPIFFKGRAEKIESRIELTPINLVRIGSWARAWIGQAHWAHFDSFFILNFLMTYYFLIIKNINFSIMKKYQIFVYRKKNSY